VCRLYHTEVEMNLCPHSSSRMFETLEAAIQSKGLWRPELVEAPWGGEMLHVLNGGSEQARSLELTSLFPCPDSATSRNGQALGLFKDIGPVRA
jgi:hypothetical protein